MRIAISVYEFKQHLSVDRMQVIYILLLCGPKQHLIKLQVTHTALHFEHNQDSFLLLKIMSETSSHLLWNHSPQDSHATIGDPPSGFLHLQYTCTVSMRLGGAADLSS